MIVGERKPFDEIKQSIKEYKNVLILGCGTCVSVSMAGGEKEVELLASQLKMAYNLEGKTINVTEKTIQRQCDREYIEPIVDLAKKHDTVVSMACGAGVQFIAELVDSMPVIPAVNTRFIGISEEEGSWAERCRACGDCRLASYSGICPVTMCSKGLLNGPCGGASLGKCEANKDRDCAWELIYNRLKQQGRLDKLLEAFNFYNNALQAHPARISKDL